jgi:hypothetical protein
LTEPTACLAMVCSHEYVIQAVACVKTFRFFRNEKIFILSLDTITTSKLACFDAGVVVITLRDVWSESALRSLEGRYSKRSLAYASKAALTAYLNARNYNVLLVDADILFLADCADHFGILEDGQILFVPCPHALEDRSRSRRAGLVSAGYVGFPAGQKAISNHWAAFSFLECEELPIANLYNEQKYLEHFIGKADITFVRDLGVNLSQTIISRYSDGSVSSTDCTKAQKLTLELTDGQSISVQSLHVSRSTRIHKSLIGLLGELKQLESLELNVLFGIDAFGSRDKRFSVNYGKYFVFFQYFVIRAFQITSFVFRAKRLNLNSLLRERNNIYRNIISGEYFDQRKK